MNAQQHAYQIVSAVTGQVIKNLIEVDTLEALGNAIVGQAGVKAAQTVPPITAPGPAT
jgi:hypothetical protein